MLPVLWICGPGGVGKTTAAWELYSRLAGSGLSASFVDIDQLGMCYGPPTAQNWAPEPVDDPVRYRLKALNLDAVAARHRAFGSRCLVVPGIVDPEHGVDPALLPNVDLTLCRLRADPADLARRIAARGRDSDDLDDALRDARALDQLELPGASVDTTGLGVREVVARIMQATAGWPGIAAGGEDAPSGDSRDAQCAPGGGGRDDLDGASDPDGADNSPDSPPAGQLLFICGPTAVGKSTVAWFAYSGSRRLGQNTAFADLDQIGFRSPVPAADPRDHRLKAANLAVLWRSFHARGARRMVVNGPLDRDEDLRAYTEALPGVRITVCRLHAAPERLAERVGERAAGAGSARGLAGDGLLGLSGAGLRTAVERSVAEAAALELSGVGDLRVATDGRGPRELADEVLRRAAWS
jgi:predicted ABC-type ATPase